jgi:hypothetical protein
MDEKMDIWLVVELAYPNLKSLMESSTTNQISIFSSIQIH